MVIRESDWFCKLRCEGAINGCDRAITWYEGAITGCDRAITWYEGAITGCEVAIEQLSGTKAQFTVRRSNSRYEGAITRGSKNGATAQYGMRQHN
jgi:hypothetical protein